MSHIGYTSVPNPVEGNPAAVVPDHRATEQALAASGLTYTFLRNALYADLQVPAAQAALALGQLVTNQGDGRTSYVSRQDCAAAAVAVLTGGPEHDGRAYDITGAQLFDAAQLAALYGRAGGGEVTVAAVDDDAFVAALAQGGLPEPVAQVMASFGAAIREGYLGELSGDVEAITGHSPEPLEPLLTQALAADPAKD